MLFFFNDTATTEIYTLSLHDALPISLINRPYVLDLLPGNSFIEYLVGEGFDVYLLDWGIPGDEDKDMDFDNYILDYLPRRSEEHTSELQSRQYLVCRLLLEKKKTNNT